VLCEMITVRRSNRFRPVGIFGTLGDRSVSRYRFEQHGPDQIVRCIDSKHIRARMGEGRGVKGVWTEQCGVGREVMSSCE